MLTTATQGDHERLLCSMRCLSSKCYAEVYDASPHHRISWRGVFHTPKAPFRLGGGYFSYQVWSSPRVASNAQWLACC